MITIENVGQRIVETNYYDTDNAKKGLFYLSWNAGAGRLLIPDQQKTQIREMRSAKYVIVSRGIWHGRDALELLFEDDSDTPYSITLAQEQSDRLLPDTDQGGGFVVALWARSGLKHRLPGKYRNVGELPCLQPWQEH